MESVSSVELDSDSESEPESEGNIDRSFCDTPTTYDRSGMFTNVNVSMHQRSGRILSKDQKAKELRSNNCNESVSDGGSKTVKARAVSVAVDLLAENKLCIRDSKDDNMEEYDKVVGWKDIPATSLWRQQGWARRPSREDGIYGENYATDKISFQ